MPPAPRPVENALFYSIFFSFLFGEFFSIVVFFCFVYNLIHNLLSIIVPSAGVVAPDKTNKIK